MKYSPFCLFPVAWRIPRGTTSALSSRRMDPPSPLQYSSRSLARSWKFDRVTRLCRSHIELGEGVGREKGVVKNTCKVFAKIRCGVIREYKYRRWKSWKSKERKGRGWILSFFSFSLPPFLPPTILFYYYFSYSIPRKLRFSRVQNYIFYRKCLNLFLRRYDNFFIFRAIIKRRTRNV